MPPATATSPKPSQISCAADTTACAPEPHTRLTVCDGTDTGTPPAIAAWRAGFILLPACTTLPITTEPSLFASTPLRRTASRTTSAPRSVAGTSLSAPPNAPMAVLTGLLITISREVIAVPHKEVLHVEASRTPHARRQSSCGGVVEAAFEPLARRLIGGD